MILLFIQCQYKRVVSLRCSLNLNDGYLAGKSVKLENFHLIFFLHIFAQNIDCGYTLEQPQCSTRRF